MLILERFLLVKTLSLSKGVDLYDEHHVIMVVKYGGVGAILNENCQN